MFLAYFKAYFKTHNNIFLSGRRHYVTFHPSGILRYHWSLMFTFLFTFLFTWKVAGDLKFELKFGFEIESEL